MKSLLVLILLVATKSSVAQLPASPDSISLVQINQQIDTRVVQKDTAALEKMYADDFVFSHGSGRIEGKQSWLQSVRRNTYPVRQHDSVTVQQHGNIAVVKGQMYIERLSKNVTVKYKLKFIRVYAKRHKNWQLVSHNTTSEVHL